MANPLWTSGTTAFLNGAGDQAMLRYLPNGARNQAIYSASSFTVGLLGRWLGRNHAAIRHISDGLIGSGLTLGGQTTTHYVANAVSSQQTPTTTTSPATTPSSSSSGSSAGSNSTASASAAITNSSDLSDAFNG